MANEAKPSILVIDDELDIATIIKMTLEKQGFKATSFSDPALALQEFEQRKSEYDIVLSDIRMPHLNGFEVARKVKALKPGAKIILMTAFEISNKEFQTVLPSLKIDGLVQKPVSIAKLKEIVSTHA